MNEKLAEALGHVDEKYVVQAARRKKRKRYFLGAVAAVLALVMFFNTPTIPFVVTAQAVALPTENRAPQWHGPNDRHNTYDDYDAYRAAADADQATVAAATQDMAAFFTDASSCFLEGDENRLWSPVNAAVALSVLAETAGGSTRQEILDLLGVADVQTLRSCIARIWEAGNKTSENQVRSMASSLWIDSRMKYDQSVMDTLAYDYYASVYQGKLDSSMTTNAIQNWVNNQTGGMLNQFSSGIDLTPSPSSVATAMALISTVYLKGTWIDEFDASQNTDGVFHSAGGDQTVTYMNRDNMEGYYYWGDSFGAVRLGMRNGTSMWLILPDEGKTPADVLAEGEYLQMFGNEYTEDFENRKYMKINLSMPKFEISNELDLIDGLKELGITEAFDVGGGDFGDTFETGLPVFIDKVVQASRITVDEQGVTAAAYIEMLWGTGAAAPAEEIIDFVLDRPFVFAVSTQTIPMFVGVVNAP